jgi:two-component sensor histidine kinase
MTNPAETSNLADPVTTGSAAPSRLRWRPSPAGLVIILATGLIVAVFGIFGLLCWQGYESTLEQARARAQTSADVIAEETSWIMSSSLAVLNQVAVAAADDPSQLSQIPNSAVSRGTDVFPTGVSLAIYDADGHLVSAGDAVPAPSEISTRVSFKLMQDGQDWSLTQQMRDRSGGKPMFGIGRRLSSGGTFVGVALLLMRGDMLQTLWAPQKLGPDSTISIVRDDGWVVGRYPALPQPMSLADLPVFKTLSSGASGSYLSPASPADGVARVVAFRQAPKYHFIAIASIAQDTVLAGLWGSIITVLWLMGPIAIALLIGALLTARLLRQSARTQASLAAAVANNEVLFREIHHRVKNNLQSVAALLQMQPIPREIKADMGQRIAAMSAVHEHIYRSSDFSRVMVEDYLTTLIGNIRAGADDRIKVVAEIDDLAVDKDAATPLGLIINEVVSNACKHAFPDRRNGTIRVALRQEDDTGRLVVSDDGVGFDPEAPVKGIGQRLVRALTSQLGGEASIASGPSGSTFTLTFPLARKTEAR